MQAAAGLVLGIAAGVIYDFLGVLRRGKPWWISILLDTIFWVAVAVGLFVLGLWAGAGRQRLFLAVAAALGGVIYALVFAKPIRAFWEFIVLGCGLIAEILAYPIKLLGNFLKKCGIFSKKIFSSLRLWYRIRNNIYAGRRTAAGNSPGVKSDASKTHRYSYEDNIMHIGRLRSDGNTEPALKDNRSQRGKQRPDSSGSRYGRRKRSAKLRSGKSR